MAQCPWMDSQGTVKTCASYLRYLLCDIVFDKGDHTTILDTKEINILVGTVIKFAPSCVFCGTSQT